MGGWRWRARSSGGSSRHHVSTPANDEPRLTSPDQREDELAVRSTQAEISLALGTSRSPSMAERPSTVVASPPHRASRTRTSRGSSARAASKYSGLFAMNSRVDRSASMSSNACLLMTTVLPTVKSATLTLL